MKERTSVANADEMLQTLNHIESAVEEVITMRTSALILLVEDGVVVARFLRGTLDSDPIEVVTDWIIENRRRELEDL